MMRNFRLKKRSGKVGRDAIRNTVDLEGIFSSSVSNKVRKIFARDICVNCA